MFDQLSGPLAETVARYTRNSPRAQPIHHAISELVKGVRAGEGATWEAWQLAGIAALVEDLADDLAEAERSREEIISG